MRLPKPALIAATLAVLAAGSVAVAVAAPPQAAGKAETILPGQWEYSYRIGPIPAGKEDRCLKQADVDQFTKGICTRRYTCDYETRVVRDGKVALKGTWTDKKGRVAPVTANGAYTPESFRLNVHMKTINGIPLAGVMDARRVSAECKPG
jgi:opacity protein-like surface antigen